jgi:hypothetical protein
MLNENYRKVKSIPNFNDSKCSGTPAISTKYKYITLGSGGQLHPP